MYTPRRPEIEIASLIRPPVIEFTLGWFGIVVPRLHNHDGRGSRERVITGWEGHIRFKSHKIGGYQVFAVSGTNTISFGIDYDDANRKGLLGFAVERIDPTENQRFFMFGFKVFPSVVPKPDEKTAVKTFDHPVQSFVWDDFTAKPGRDYEYVFHPLKGAPKNLDRSAKPISISVRTEKLFSDLEHDVFFNRGVASSQAYAREFGNKKPDKLVGEEQKRAREWLSRSLDDALIGFIANAKRGDTLLCCFYEFRYLEVAEALKASIDRGVDVKLIIDAKVNERTDKKGVFHESFPREENLRTIGEARLPKSRFIFREAKPGQIQHNKFMVLLKGRTKKPTEVWSGSTNLSDGGFHGQTNVGHWVRDGEVATQFQAYWELLSGDPGPVAGDDRATSLRKNKELRDAVEAIGEVPESFADIQAGVTPVFSPRNGLSVLDMYAHMVDEAKDVSCITLAFGISDEFKTLLKDNTTESHIAFFLLEKEDKANPRSKKEFVGLGAINNVYKAWGSFLKGPLYQWTRETNAKALGLNQHVSYVHSKFLLKDPLSKDPIVVTGSANFSKASTNDNDENMLIIRGNQRVADIYFTEFNRLFNHYYFRSVQEATAKLDAKEKKRRDEQTLFLSETDDWLKKYKKGSLKRKRVEIFTRMQGFSKVP
jgi:phosphatidylserine/phosphatidylglycerophosphate/cardiolipin synthase-like enzyme